MVNSNKLYVMYCVYWDIKTNNCYQLFIIYRTYCHSCDNTNVESVNYKKHHTLKLVKLINFYIICDQGKCESGYNTDCRGSFYTQKTPASNTLSVLIKSKS